MQAFFALPMEARLTLVFLVGCAVGSIVNWAIYTLAWNRRPYSPWASAPPGLPRRGWRDRIPILGWWRLRRETPFHGHPFWIRPLVVECLLGAGYAVLYWWEVDCQGLYADQLTRLASTLDNRTLAGAVVPVWLTHLQFSAHAILIAWMAAASFIDIDEKLIPDGITVTGTLAGLALIALAPMALLPHVAVVPQGLDATLTIPLTAPARGMPLPPGFELVSQAVTPTAPNTWPVPFQGAPHWRSLVLGIACFSIWCIALIERVWRGRRGAWFGLKIIAARVFRDCRQLPMAFLFPVGILGIFGLWGWGGDHWAGLLSALIGLIGGGSIVWLVRIIGSAALKREAMGFGDVTLMMMMGVFLGWQACLILFFLAPFAGLLIGIFQWVCHRDDVIPFGPFLCLAAGYVLVAWADIWNWGQQLFQIQGLVPMALVVCLAVMGLALMIWQAIKEMIFGIRRN